MVRFSEDNNLFGMAKFFFFDDGPLQREESDDETEKEREKERISV